MQTTRAVVIGGATALALLHVSWLTDGLAEASALLLALFVAVATLGVVVAAAWEVIEQAPYRRLPMPASWSHRRGHRRCALCHGRMSNASTVWVCGPCDRQGAVSSLST